MCLRERQHLMRGWDVEIVATDISAGALARAREASYSDFEVERGLPHPMRQRYFTHADNRYVVQEALRDMVRFLPLNLIERWPIAESQDIIFMRNVLIYFDDATKVDILKRALRLLTDDGVLFLGSTESPPQGFAGMQRTVFGPAWGYTKPRGAG
jgi:chemotaxis protein methyltransferase CheR